MLCYPHDMSAYKTIDPKALRLVSNVPPVKDLCCFKNGKYSVTLVFFGSNWRRVSLLGRRLSIVLMASAIKWN